MTLLSNHVCSLAMKSRHNRSWLAGVAILFLAGTSGCSVDGTGAVYGTVTAGPDGTVVTVTALGGSGRTMREDAGLALGVSRTVYLYPGDNGSDRSVGRYIGHVPMPDGPPAMIHRRFYGAGADVSQGVHLTLGMRDLVMPVPGAIPADSVLSIAYDAREPDASRVQVCAVEEAVVHGTVAC